MSFLKNTLENPLHAEPHSVRLANGVTLEFLDTGCLRIRPKSKPRYRLLISCGIHGNETAPIEIVEQLFSDIKDQSLTVNNDILLIIGNPLATKRGERFIDENLNRLFSGKHAQSTSLEASRAKLIEDVTHDFFSQGDEPRLHYDLHTAIRGSKVEKFAVYPYLHKRPWSKVQLGFLESCGVQAVLLSNQPAGTYSYYTSRSFAAHSFTVELGKVHKFGDNDMNSFRAITQGLRRVISGAEKFSAEPQSLRVFEVVEEVIKRTEAFKLHIDADAKNFTQFKQGILLASDTDYQYRTKVDGEGFVFPISNVPVGQRAMLIIAPADFPFNQH